MVRQCRTIQGKPQLSHPNGATVSHHLTWSHYVELLKIENELERTFYEKQTILENWSVRELKRQKETSLFLCLASTKDKEGILQLSKQGQAIEKPTDILRDTYIFEFLKIPEPHHLTETDLEQRLITHLEEFLLELGKALHSLEGNTALHSVIVTIMLTSFFITAF